MVDNNFALIHCHRMLCYSFQERRKKAVSELLKVLRHGGKALIYVWAIEQKLNKVKSKYLKTNSTGAENTIDAVEEVNTQSDIASSKLEGKCGEIDNFKEEHSEVDGTRVCCTNLKTGSSNNQHKNGSLATGGAGSLATENVGYCNSSMKESVSAKSSASDIVTDSERDLSSNKQLEVHVNRTEFKQQDVLVPWQLKNKVAADKDLNETVPETFHRFYHVFQKGELETLCESTGLCKVLESYYDQGNWAIVLERT